MNILKSNQKNFKLILNLIGNQCLYNKRRYVTKFAFLKNQSSKSLLYTFSSSVFSEESGRI